MAVSNNLQFFAASLGMGGGAFVALTGIMGALQLVAQNWDRIQAWWKNGPSPEELKRIAEKAKAMQDEFKAIIAKPTPDQAHEAQVAAGGMEAFGNKRLSGVLGQAVSAEMPGWSDQQKRKWGIENIARFGNEQQYNAAMAQAEQDDRRKRVDAEVQRLMTEAQKPGNEGAAARDRILQLARAHPDLIPADLVQKMTTRPSSEMVGPPVEAMNGPQPLPGWGQAEQRHMNFLMGPRPPGGPKPRVRRPVGAERLAAQQAGIGRGPTELQQLADLQNMAGELMGQFDQANPARQDQIMVELDKLERKMIALQRRLSRHFGGPPPGAYAQLPEAW
jgi:hypothetical protein